MKDFSSDIENCLRVLQNGGVILYPTDTIWGIGCDATNAEAVNRVYEIKKRPANKSFVILVTDEKDILQHVAAPDMEVFNYLQQASKSVTVIYENVLGIAENAMAADGSAAIRICNNEFCRHLIKRFRKPIVSTSANISGEPSPAIFKEINPELIHAVDYTVFHRRDDEEKATASSIIKWKNGKVEVIRE